MFFLLVLLTFFKELYINISGGKMEDIKIGIIGGSGFYDMEFEDAEYIHIDTPFGQPSEKILIGKIDNVKIAFLSRHGIGHRFSPSEVNYRANLFALKTLGVKNLVSFTAVGSLKEELKPTDLVIPDQYYDNTFKREKTFFENGIVGHVSMAEPTCPVLSDIACKIAKEIGLSVHKGGTYFNMEGPQFSSRAESFAYRHHDFSIIGMTQAIEAKLAKELEMCFLPLAFVTDYDCWHEDTENVSVDMVIENLNKNTSNAQKIVNLLATSLTSDNADCKCETSLEYAIMTDPKSITYNTFKRLKPIICKYIKEPGDKIHE